MKAQELRNRNKPPNLLLYGPPGAGKTALSSQASGGYMFDCDDGMRTALTLDDKFSPLRQAIEFDIYVDDNPEAPRAYTDVKNKLLSIRKLVAEGKWPYNACVLDTITGLCRSIQLHVMSCSGGAFKIPKIQHYGQMVNELESILTILRSINVLTVVTAHEMAVETEAGGVLIRIMSATKPHGMNKLPWLFDEVLYCKCRARGQGKFDYIVSGRETSAIMARTRSGIKDDIVINDIGLKGLLERVGYNYKPLNSKGETK